MRLFFTGRNSAPSPSPACPAASRYPRSAAGPWVPRAGGGSCRVCRGSRRCGTPSRSCTSLTRSFTSSSRRMPWYSSVARMARSLFPFRVFGSGASSSALAWAALMAGVLPSPVAVALLGLAHAGDGVALHGVPIAQVGVERAERGEFAADGGRAELAAHEVVAPGDDVGPGDRAGSRPGCGCHVGAEVAEVGLVGLAGVGVAEVREPLDLGRRRAASCRKATSSRRCGVCNWWLARVTVDAASSKST